MSVRKNVLANFSGSIWTALMSLAFVPFYIRLMGVESYGIVGVYVSLVALLSVLDLGLSQTINREMARLSHDKKNLHLMASTARTLEIVYWVVALIIGIVVALLAAPIAKYWLNPQQLSPDDLQLAIQIMGLVIALRWPLAFYLGGLNGLQRQVIVNIVLGVFATLQGLGALAVLWFIDPTIKAFFLWQAAIAVVQIVVVKWALWSNIPNHEYRVFDKSVLRDIWRFAAGMSGVSLLATILTQLDKLVLSKILPLTEFGYYTFAAAVAAVIFRLVGPVFTAYYPRLTQLATRGDQESLVNSYHLGSQLMAVAILPVALVLVFFSNEILELWTQNQTLVQHTSLLVSLLIVGNALNGIMHLPYALQLAHGWTRLALIQNSVAVVILVPAIYFATMQWGTVGAAIIWIALNVGYLLLGNHFMHRRLLTNEKWQWYLNVLFKPLLSIVAVCWIAQLLWQESAHFWSKSIGLIMVLFVSVIAAIMSSDLLRAISKNFLVSAFRR